MAEGRTINSFKNVIWSYINFVVGLVLGLVNRSVFLSCLGIGYLGINGLFTNVISILSLADMGLSTAMAYSYYKPISENDTNKIIALNNFYKKVYNIVAIFVTVLGMLVMPFLPYLVNLDNSIDNLYVYYLLTLAGTITSYLAVYKSTLLNAYQKNYVVSKYNSIMKILVSVVQIVFLFLTKNYIIYLVVVAIGNLINNLRISFVADKQFPFLKGKQKLGKEEQKNIFSNVKSMFIYKLSSVLINSTDNILISIFVGTIWVGYYNNYLMIITQVTTLITMTFTSLTASVGNLVASENDDKKYSTFKSIQIASFWFATVIIGSIYLVINDFIIVWLGVEFILDELTLFAIMFNLYLTCVLQPIWIYREATGLYRKTKNVMIITALLNVGLSILGGVYIGLAGILLASAISKILTYVWFEPILLFKEHFKKNPSGYFVPTIINLAITGGFIVGMFYLIRNIHLNGFVGFIAKGVIVFIISNILYLLCYGKNKHFKNIFTTIKKIFSKKQKNQKSE